MASQPPGVPPAAAPAADHHGRFAEHWIVSTLLLAALGYLLWRNTGIAGLVNHLHDSGTAAP